MEKATKVSILVPVYRAEDYIVKCAESLFLQTYKDIEYVFVNDCAKDNSIELLNSTLLKYPHRKDNVIIVNHSCNRGVAAARNTAVETATGDFLMWVDPDDYLDVNAVDLLVQELNRTLADVIIFSNYSMRTDGVVCKHASSMEKHYFISLILLNTIPGVLWNKIIRASLYKEQETLFVEGHNQGEDYSVIPRILYSTSNIVWFDKPLYYYNELNVSSYSNNINIKSIYNQLFADDTLYSFFKDKEEYEAVLPLIYIRSLLFLIKTSIPSNYKDAVEIYSDRISLRWMKQLSLTDNIIICLLKIKMYRTLSYLIKFTKKVRYKIIDT